MTVSIRGAITVEADDKELIYEATHWYGALFPCMVSS